MEWFDDPKELSRRRREAGLSQAELGRRIGRSRSLIRDVEVGRVKLAGNLSTDLWRAISSAFLEKREKARRITTSLSEMLSKHPGAVAAARDELISVQHDLISNQQALIAELLKESDQDAAKISALQERLQILQELLAVETETALAQSKAEKLREKLTQKGELWTKSY